MGDVECPGVLLRLSLGGFLWTGHRQQDDDDDDEAITVTLMMEDDHLKDLHSPSCCRYDPQRTVTRFTIDHVGGLRTGLTSAMAIAR